MSANESVYDAIARVLSMDLDDEWAALDAEVNGR